jgi:SAM-dependent methyltransferase
MDGADSDRWSAVAADWERLWDGFAEPVWKAVLAAAPVDGQSRVLDVGCGTGGFLAHVALAGASTYGIDPAPGMVAHARARVPGADIRPGDAERLPWPDRGFDLVVSINALQFADDTLAALTECIRVTRPGGQIAIANWAEGDLNDLDTIEDAVSRSHGEPHRPDGDLRTPGGLEDLLHDGGLPLVSAGLVTMPWSAPDDDTLIHAVLLGEDPGTVAATAPTVIAAAQPFRTPDGGYHLVNAFRYAIGRTPL